LKKRGRLTELTCPPAWDMRVVGSNPGTTKKSLIIQFEIMMGLGQFFLTWVRLGQFFVARVGSHQPFMVWVWKISPKNVKFFNFFPFGSKKYLQVRSKSTRVKGRSASYLLRVKSKLGFGRVGSGHGPALVWNNNSFQVRTFTYLLRQSKQCLKNLTFIKTFISRKILASLSTFTPLNVHFFSEWQCGFIHNPCLPSRRLLWLSFALNATKLVKMTDH